MKKYIKQIVALALIVSFASCSPDDEKVDMLSAGGSAVAPGSISRIDANVPLVVKLKLKEGVTVTKVEIYRNTAANYKQSIGEQAWIALFNRGFEAWSSYRRLDFPVLTVPAVTYNGLSEVPKRYSYPAREETINGVSTAAAIAKIPGGKNTLTAKIFWDKF